MRLWVIGLSAVMAMTSPSLAQDSDTQQILKLLQGMNGRFDKIEERLDKVEKCPTSTPPTSPATTIPDATAVPADQTPKGVAVPGWRIDVFPLIREGVSTSLIARTSAPIGRTTLSLHFEGGPVSNQVNYHGTAFFRSNKSGVYTFSIALDNSKSRSSWFKCQGSLNVEDKVIIEKFMGNEPVTMSGNVDLQEGVYQISYDVGCWRSGHNLDYQLDSDVIEDSYKKLAYWVKVLPPDDMKLRDFEPDELFYVAPPEKKSEVEPATIAPGQASEALTALAYADPAEPALTEAVIAPQAVQLGGLLLSNSNLRATPSKGGAVRAELRKGMVLFVVEQEGRWYKVRLRSGQMGYVHDTLIALQE